jgi:Response regulator containing a CheY-like receiver domain and an HTH DNA-binding domain
MNTCTVKQAEGIPGTRIRTLVVDDSLFMLKILAQLLEADDGFELVGTATDGRKALRYVSVLSPDLVLDLHMPGLNGIQATRYIKDHEHPPAVIIVTSDDSPVTKATADDAGADAFVSKDGNLRHQLIGALQNLFGPSGEKREAVGSISFQNRLADYSKQEHGT